MQQQQQQSQRATNSKQQAICYCNCSQCLTIHDITKLIYMAEFATHICKQCYHQQSTALMLYKQNKPTLYPSIDQITSNLYLGNEDAACDIQTIKTYNIQGVCVCGDYLQMPFKQQLSYKQFLISDSLQQEILNLFDSSYQWIESMIGKNKIILVHCAAGVSRSASFVIAYLMKAQKLSYQQAYSFVKEKRSIVRPNSGFIRQLKTYDQILATTRNEINNEEKVIKKHSQ